MAIPPLIVLENIGFLPGRQPVGGAAQWNSFASARRTELARPTSSPAFRTGPRHRSDRMVPIIYGGWRHRRDRGATVEEPDQRKRQGRPPSSPAVPELCHNEIVGWGQHGDITRQVFSMVHLRHDRRASASPCETFGVRSASCSTRSLPTSMRSRPRARDPVAQLLDLVMYYGDFVSLYLAVQVGLDPGPGAGDRRAQGVDWRPELTVWDRDSKKPDDTGQGRTESP